MSRVYLIIGVLIALALFGAYEYNSGYNKRDAEMQSEIARKNEEVREKERALDQQLNASASKLQEANNAINEKQSVLDRAIRAGRLRLPASSCVQTSTGAPAPSGGGDQATSESERQTLAAIAAIVAQGDRNTEQLNACIDSYNAVREQVNSQGK